MDFTLEEVMETHRRMYGGKVWNFNEFQTFEEAFCDAWNDYDYISGETPEELAEAMLECWQLNYPGPDPFAG